MRSAEHERSNRNGGEKRENLRYAARQEAAMRAFLEEGGFGAFTTTTNSSKGAANDCGGGTAGVGGGAAGMLRSNAAIAANAWPARIARDGTLHVATSSSAWAFELTPEATNERCDRAAAVFLAALPGTSASAVVPGPAGQIAFQSERDGDFEIYAIRPDGTGLRKLTNNACDDTEPDWSGLTAAVRGHMAENDSHALAITRDIVARLEPRPALRWPLAPPE